MDYSGKYFNPKKYLPYQRNFIFINSERGIGKTYSTQGFLLEQAITKGEEFIYLVRTQDEKKNGVFQKAFAKVVSKEFPKDQIDFTQDECSLKIEGKTEKEDERITLGYCVALTEATKFKKRNLPNVRWFIFDEYILDEKGSSTYINGWNEPSLLLSIYHTVDRERDYVTCFLLANNISFYNPYHMHSAFNIPHVERNEIWYSENVLFHWTEGSAQLKEEKSRCKFLRMIENSEYGAYSKDGRYINDNTTLIEERPSGAFSFFNIIYNKETFGVWVNDKGGLVYIDSAHDPSRPSLSLTIDDHKENTLLTKDKTNVHIKWLSKAFKQGNVRFTCMEVKSKAENVIKIIL